MRDKKAAAIKKKWENKSLSQIATIKTGKHDANHQDPDGNYPFYTCAVGQFRSSTYTFDGPSIILPGNGANVGKSFFYDGKFEAYQRTYVVNGLSPIVHPWFLFYCFEANWADYIASRQFGSATNYIVVGDLKAFPIPLPSLPEQQRVIGILDEAFESIATAMANAEKNLQNARAIFESHLQSVFTQRVEGWVYTTLGEVCTRVEYGSSAKSKEQGRIPVLRMGNIQNGSFVWDKLVYSDNGSEIDKYLLQHNDVLFNRTNSPELVGKTAIYKSEMPAIFAGYLIRIHRKENLLDADYLNYFLNSNIAKEYGKTVVISSVNQANINGQKLKSYPIPVPPLKEQQTIVQKLDALAEETQRLESIYQQKLAALDALKKSLLDQAFTGQL